MTIIYVYSRINGVIKRFGVWLDQPALKED